MILTVVGVSPPKKWKILAKMKLNYYAKKQDSIECELINIYINSKGLFKGSNFFSNKVSK